MKKVYITFPQICVETAVVEVTDEQFENLLQHCGDAEKAAFIWDNIPEPEKQWTPLKKSLYGFVETGYIGIYEHDTTL